jgi:hypothetical protein
VPLKLLKYLISHVKKSQVFGGEKLHEEVAVYAEMRVYIKNIVNLK